LESNYRMNAVSQSSRMARGVAVAAVLLTILGDWLFVGHGLGWAVGAYAFLLTSAALASGGFSSGLRRLEAGIAIACFGRIRFLRLFAKGGLFFRGAGI